MPKMIFTLLRPSETKHLPGRHDQSTHGRGSHGSRHHNGTGQIRSGAGTTPSEEAPDAPSAASTRGQQFKPGDRVRSSSGSPARVVAPIGNDRVALLHDDGKREIVKISDVKPYAEDQNPAKGFTPEDYYQLPEPDITRPEELSLMFYRGNGYQEINRQLRENEGDLDSVDDPDIKNRIKDLDRAIKRNKLDRDMTVYRGIGASFARDLFPGAEIEVSAFSSTSMSREKAEEFAGNGVLMSIELPKGTNALKAFEGDFEILLPRDIGMVVDRVEGGVVYVKLEEW